MKKKKKRKKSQRKQKSKSPKEVITGKRKRMLETNGNK